MEKFSGWIKKKRDPVSGLTHLVSAILSGIGTLVLLYLGRGSLVKEISLLVYGVNLTLMFSASAVYHLATPSPERLLRLRKLDHSAIYLLIAGTYTPICLYFFSGFWRWRLLAIIWGMALVGVGVKVFVINAPRWITAGVYLVMGWMALLAVGEMLRSMPPAALAWVVIGGLWFTLGAVVYITKRPDFYPKVFGFHEVWHIFVILGCLSHFIVVARFIAPG